MTKKIRYFLWITVSLAASLWLAAFSVQADEDSDYLAARNAYRMGHIQQLPLYAARLQNSVLLPYVQYWQLSSRLKDASASEIRDFIARNTDSILSEKMRADWLRLLGRNEMWSTYLVEYPLLSNPDVALQCDAVRGRIAQGETLALKDGVALWLTGRDMPETCTSLFQTLLAQRLITPEDVWHRFRLALEAGNPGVAKALNAYLPAHLRYDPRQVNTATAAPARWLNQASLDLDERVQRELTIYAVVRLARSNARNAVQRWEAVRARFPIADQQYVWGQLGLWGARQHLPEALDWFNRAGQGGMNDELLAWEVREALRLGKWDVVQTAILSMSEAGRAEPAWRYWLARTYKLQNKPYEANLLLAPLSTEHHFYGLLAEEELGVAASAPVIHSKVSKEEVAVLRRIPAIARALILHQLNLRFEAANEWIWATRNFDDRRLLAAAELARQHDWYDRAINTADRTRKLHDFELRFLTPYRDIALKYAKEYGLDEAWVYGLMRQESRFVSRAKSQVGAAGLMQIMPATARWIAGKLGVRRFQAGSIHELDTNMQFGMYYLKTIQQDLGGSNVLATAGYNAGPGRARRWRSDQALEGAIYAESIPFNETRDYVKKVMSNAIYYARGFGQSGYSLKARMGTVPGTSGQ